MKHLRRKVTLRAHGEQVVFVKHKQERMEHVWMKAFLWALHLPAYPDLAVEVDVGDTYKPDVVQMDRVRGVPVFWGEAGHASPDKMASLLRRYRDTHVALCKWNRSLDPFLEPIETAVHGVDRTAPVDLFSVPDDAADRWIDDRGRISVTRADLTWIRVGNAGSWD
jgi:hypothetical protein